MVQGGQLAVRGQLSVSDQLGVLLFALQNFGQLGGVDEPMEALRELLGLAKFSALLLKGTDGGVVAVVLVDLVLVLCVQCLDEAVDVDAAAASVRQQLAVASIVIGLVVLTDEVFQTANQTWNRPR